MKKFFVKTLAMLLVCMFVISGINFSIFASDAISPGDLGDTLVAMNVAITGRVKMLFYFIDTDNVNRYVVDIDGEESRTVYVQNMAVDSKGRNVLEVSLAAAQQSVKVKITPYAADGTVGKVRKYSVTDYANQVIALAATNDSYKAAAEALKSMLNYGAMSQLSFDYNKDNLANDGLYFGSTNPVNNMTSGHIYGVDDLQKNATNVEALDLGNVNAYLKDSISLKFYLNHTCDKSALRVTIEDEDCGNEIFTDADGDYVLIDNIPATKFNYQYSIKVTDGDNILTIKCSVLNYVKSLVALDGTSEAEELGITAADMNAARAMFQYYVKMWEYVNKAEPEGKPTTCDHKRSYVDTKLEYAEICSDCGKDITPVDIVENANDLANGVTSYFGTQDGKVDGDRENYVVENGNMNLYYPLASSQLATVTNKNGDVYVQNTMDVYVKTADGTYYASNSVKSATANIYRYGYYYYDIHAYGQNFLDGTASGEPTGTEKSYDLTNFYKSVLPNSTELYANEITTTTTRGNASSSGISCTINGTSDPYVYGKTSIAYKLSEYNAVQITMTLESTSSVQLRYTTASGSTEYNDTNMLEFDTKPGTHTYTVYFDDHTSSVYGLRLDFNGKSGENITISKINFVKIDLGENAPDLLLDRGLHTYTDKMHQVLSIVAPSSEVTGITEVGMTTNVTATGVVIVTENGTKYETLASGMSVSDVAYAGFLTEAGVFGYILPYGDESSTITVSYDGSTYTITQTIVPAYNGTSGTIGKQPTIYSSSDLASYIASDSTIGTSLNIYNSPTQFYFGQRIYTDTETTFDTFLEEAYIERNPLTAENIKIDTDKTPDATFDGYDGYRGMYAFTIPENIGFNPGYYYAQNFHGAVSFSIKGDEYNRNMYVMAYSYGCSVEGGAVLDRDDTLLPIPTEVAKNFDHEFEEPVWLWGDVGYSEVRIPVYVNAGETEELTVLQTYMNWGQYPLKQISSIQFFAPYYHLSTGVTESNCIANYYVMGKDLQTLPDHRAASAPFWSSEVGDTSGDGFDDGDPQHDNGGYHLWLQYTDSSSNKVASEPVSSVINSSGLTYADIDMTYVSDDGKIQVTYTHMEMPQTDENRAYYEMRYTILEDVAISDFANNFSFYSVYGYGNGYQTFGYYGTSAVNGISANTAATYTLGSDHPYFDLYNIDNLKSDGTQNIQNANVSFLIDSDKCSLPNSLSGSSFIVNVANRTASLSLNAGSVTLKAGEEIVICAIIMPWGDHNSTDDTLVQNVRANTLVNPIVATAGEHATVDTDSVFLPIIETTNGLDATFTIGHADANNAPTTREDMGINVAFRVDGFKVLTTPKLYEKIDGNWQLVELSSINSPDISGNAHNYDGYFVHYDAASKTYSYSFVTNINGSSRTFMVLVDDTYVEWEESHGDLYFGADAIYKFASNGSNLTAATGTDDDGTEFVTLTSDANGNGDSSTGLFKIVGGSAAKYMVIKYRIDPNNTDDKLQFYMNTNGANLSDSTGKFDLECNSVVKQTGTWQVMVVDLASIVAEKNLTDMVANAAGSYSLSNFRFDPFTQVTGDSFDVEYIAFCNDIYSAIEMNSDMDISDISYVSGTTKSGPISDQLEVMERYENMNVVFVGSGLAGIMTDGSGDVGITGATVNSDGTVTVEYASDNNDEYFSLYVSGVETGKYLVMKYKTGDGLTSADGSFWAMAYTSAGNTGHVKTYGLKADGEWHTLVIDLTKLGTGIADVDGKYYVTTFRTDLFDSLSANGSVDFAYIGLCDELTDIPSENNASLEYSANFKNNVDHVYVDGSTTTDYNSATSVTATTLQYVGWLGSAGMSADGISYVVTDASGNETIVDLTNSESGTNIYFTGSDTIQDAVASLGTGTVGYVVRFTADLSEWNGQTVTLSIRETVDGIATVETYSITVTVPKAEEPGWINGQELLAALSTGKFSGTLNDDGSVTITSTAADGDGALEITTHANGLTPKYAVIKYKTSNQKGYITVLATTGTNSIGGYVQPNIKVDNEWHTLVVDLTTVTAGYNYGDAVKFLRLDICEGATDYSMTIDHVYLCEDLSYYAGEFVEPLSGNTVDDLYVDGDTNTNLKAESTITGTTVYYKGWLRANGFSADSVYYVITDAEGNETIVPLTLGATDTAVTNTYYERTDVTDDAVNSSAWSNDTVGYGIIFETDLSAYAGQTVTISIREAIDGGAIVETYSVKVAVPANEEPEAKDPEIIYHPGYISGSDIHNKVNASWHTSELNSDGSVTITGNGTVSDAYIMLTDYASGLTPRYAIMRYKTTDESSMTVLASSGSTAAGPWTSCSLITDGEWHIVVVDLTTVTNSGFVDGETVSYLRLDLCEDIGVNQSITIDYVLLCNDSDVPMTLDPNYVSGAELLTGLNTGGFEGTLNDDGSLTVECTDYTDGTITLTSMISGTPKYAVIRYKNTDVSQFIIYATTTGKSHKENYVTLKTDGAWHVVVVDLESVSSYTSGDAISLLRFDFLDSTSTDYSGKSLILDYVWFTDVISDVEYEVYDKLNISYAGSDLYYQGTDHYGDSNTSENSDSQYTIKQNDDGTVTVTRKNTDGEVYITALFNRDSASAVVTGKYFVIKYRTSASGVTGMGSLFASTSAYSATGTNDYYSEYKAYNDGEWHVAAFDLSNITNVVDNGDGTYTVNFVRFAFNGLAVGETVDIAYIGLCDSLSDVEAGYDVSFTKDTITSNGNVTLNKTDEILTVTSTGATTDAGRFWVTVPESTVTGKYIVVRYKYNATNANNGSLVNLNTWTSTTNSSVTGGDNQKVNVLADGEWHTIVIDATKGATVSEVDGTYSLKYVGFDFFTTSTANNGDYVEISYIGFSDSLEDIVAKHGAVEYDLDYQFTNDGASLGGSTHTSVSSVKTSTSTGNNYTGWAIVDGKITGMYYKIVSGTGETEWIDVTVRIMDPNHESYATYNAAFDRGIWLGGDTTQNAENVATMTIPAAALSGYASGEIVTVYVAASVDGLNGAYVVLISSEMTIS